jgi:exodeoxyribonuclease VII small subunit
MTGAKAPLEAEEPGFDARLERLEGIVNALEEGGLSLEQSIERYREGILLLEKCRALLDGYRRQVEELGRGVEGELRPFAADPDVAG